jgi:Abortive infection alpha
MNEMKLIADAIKTLGLDEVIPEIYRDLLQPAARKVGGGLETIAEAVRISLAPLEAGIWGYERVKQWLSLRVTSILVDRGTKEIKPPPLSVAGPLVFQLIFAYDEPDLRELYASLLASAMDPHMSNAHPSFVTIIQQLTSDEAKILKTLAQSNDKYLSLSSDKSSRNSTGLSVAQQFKTWCKESNVFHPDCSEAYLDNLVRLRIFHQVAGHEARFEPEGGNRYGTYEASVTNKEYEFIELTDFGQLFLDACIEKKF